MEHEPNLPDIEDIGAAIEQFETDLFLFATVASVIVHEFEAILKKANQTIDVLSQVMDTDSQMSTAR
jgi:hypothetical protein